MGQQMVCADAFAPILLRLPCADGRARNLPDHAREDHVALELDPALLQGLSGDHEGCKPALHVRDAEALNLVAHDPALELRIRLHVGDHAQIRAGAGEARIGVAVEAKTQSRAIALDDADSIRTVDGNILAHGLDTVGLEPGQNVFGDCLFLTCRARNGSEIATDLRQLIAVNVRQDFCCRALVKCHQALHSKRHRPDGGSCGDWQ